MWATREPLGSLLGFRESGSGLQQAAPEGETHPNTTMSLAPSRSPKSFAVSEWSVHPRIQTSDCAHSPVSSRGGRLRPHHERGHAPSFFFSITTSSVPSLRKLTCDRFARGANPEKWLSRLTARAACRAVSSTTYSSSTILNTSLRCSPQAYSRRFPSLPCELTSPQ